MLFSGRKNRIRIAVVFAVLTVSAVFTACGSDEPGYYLTVNEQGAGSKDPGYLHISMEDAKWYLAERSDYILLDVRTEDEYKSGHIPGAINLPNEEIGDTEIPELPDKSKKLLVYCRTGRRSKEASEKLVKLGYTGVMEFGGITDWDGEIVTGE